MQKYAMFAIMILVFAPPILAQVENGAITGVVTDPTDARVPGATIALRNMESGVRSTTETNAEGYYTLPFLRPGTYEVAVAKAGFKKVTVSNIKILVGLTATVNIKLEIGDLAGETVVVEATAVQLERQSASLGNVVGRAQLTELPLSGRSPYALVTLAPGVMPAGNEGTGPIINGGRSNTSEILLDGAESRNSTTNDITYRPPLEAVAEFKVITNNFSAEYGRSGGGVLTAATRSGTNELHGSFFEFLRNDIFNANGWTRNKNGQSRPRVRHNEYGFAVGGPVYIPKAYDGRDKTHFFVTLEKVPEINPDDMIYTVPTALQKIGDFSQNFDRNGNLIKIYDPATTRVNPANPSKYIRDQFPDNKIPLGRLNPIAVKLLKFYPDPTNGDLTNNFIQNARRSNYTTRWFIRIDHAIGSKQTLFFTYGHSFNEQSTPGINIAFPSDGTNGEKGTRTMEPQTFMLSDTVVFRPNLIGEFRMGLTRQVVNTSPRSQGYDWTQLGFAQSLYKISGQIHFPRINIQDFASLGPDRASDYYDAEYSTESIAHISWIHGAHTIKTGFEFAFLAANVKRPEAPSGRYDFNRNFTYGPDPNTTSGGNGVATLLLGAPTGGNWSFDPASAASQKYWSFYVNDDWKLRRNLTLNLGMRWEYNEPWTERFNQLGYFDPNVTDPQSGLKGLLVFCGKDGNPRTQYNPDKNNFAPRLGLAWEFLKNTVARAGYAMQFFPGNGGIGSSPSDMGSGFVAQTSTSLLPLQSAPNTPPPGATMADAFQSGLFYPPSDGVGGGINTAFRDYVIPVNHAWNLNIQRMLPYGIIVETAYAGSRAMNYWINRERNAVSVSNLGLGAQLDSVVANPYYGKITTGALSAKTVRYSQLLRPWQQYQGITRFRDAVGKSNYNSFTLSVQKRMSHGLLLQGNYTISKQLDNARERFAGGGDFADPNNIDRYRAIVAFDRPHYLVLNYIYELPFGQGKAWGNSGWISHILGNWQLSGITTIAKGVPLIITNNSANNTGLPGVSGNIPNRSGDPLLPSDQRTLNRYFDTSVFSTPVAYTLGNGSRTEPRLRTPGIIRFDFGLFRSQKLWEGAFLQLRLEAFNAFNRVNFNGPNTAVGNVDFGRITSAGGGRELQIGVRISY
jgi:hypothetical protein